MAKSIFTGQEVDPNSPFASIATGVGYSSPFAITASTPDQKQEQYVAEHLQSFTEKAESEQGLDSNDLLMTARAFIDGLWLNKSEEAGSYVAATMVYLLDPELSQGKSISQIADEMQLSLEAESARFSEESPWMAGVSNVAGSILSPVSLAAGGVLSQAAKLRQGAQATRAADEVGAALGGSFARAGADDASRLAAELGRQQAATTGFLYKGIDPTGKIALTLSRATPGQALAATAGVAAAEGAVIGAEGQTWEEKAKNAAFTAGISAAVPIGFAGVKKSYDFATESKLAQQLGEGADFVNLMFTDHGLSQFYRSVVSKAYGGRTLSEQQARQMAGRAVPTGAARQAAKETRDESASRVKEASEIIGKNTKDALEQTSLRMKSKIAEVEKLAEEAKGARKAELDNELSILKEALENSDVAKTLAVKEADELVNSSNAFFRGQALREATPSGATADEINVLGALDPQDANAALDNLWKKYGFTVANGKTYKLDSENILKFIDDISKDYADLALVGAERGGIVGSIKNFVKNEIESRAPDGIIKGEDLVQLRSTIGRAINGLSDASTSTRRFSSEVQSYFDDVIQEGLSKTERETFAADRYAWSIRSVVDDATLRASGGDARGGAFTAEDYLNSIKAFSGRFAARGQGRLQKEAQDLAIQTKQNKENILRLADEQVKQARKDIITANAKRTRELEAVKKKINAQQQKEIEQIRREAAVTSAGERGREILQNRLLEARERHRVQMADLDSQIEKAMRETEAMKDMMPPSFKGSVFENLFNTALIGQIGLFAVPSAGQQIGATLATGAAGARILSSELAQRILARQTSGQAKFRRGVNIVGQAMERRGLTTEQTVGGQAGLVAQATTPKEPMFSKERKSLIRKMPTRRKAQLHRGLEAKGALERLKAEDIELFKELQRARNAAG